MTINRQSISRFLLQELEKQRQSLFLWAPICVGAGIITCLQWQRPIDWFYLIPALVFAAVAVARAYNAYGKTGKSAWFLLLLSAAAVTLFVSGYALMQWRDQRVATPMITEKLPPQVVEGTIEKLVALDGGKAKRVVLKDVVLDTVDPSYKGRSHSEENKDTRQSKEDNGRYRIRLKTYHFKGEDWQIGDRVRVKAKLIPPSPPVMPGGFDFSRKAYYDGFSAVGFTMGQAEMIAKGITSEGILERIRQAIAQRMYQSMDPRQAAIALALLTGERDGITKEDDENFRESGLAHLLAISGFNIALVAGCVFFSLRLFLVCLPNVALSYPIKKWAAAAALFMTIFYTLLAGATVPTVRACIMTSVVLFAVMLDRSAMNMRLLALSALFIMVTTPEAVTGPSFALSFSAVTALIIFYRDYGRNWMVNAHSGNLLLRPVFYLAGIAVTSAVATLATAPFSILFFNKFAIYAVLSNILSVPLMVFVIMPAGLAACLLSPFGLDMHIWKIMEWGIIQTIWIAKFFAEMDYASIPFPSFGFMETALLLVGFLILMIWNGKGRLIGLPLVVAAFLMAAFYAPKQVLIADDMKAILVVDRSSNDLYLIGKMNSYLRSNWLGFYGYDEDLDIPSYTQGDQMPQKTGSCDDFTCRMRLNDVRITVLFDALQMAQSCRKTDIVIATMPIKDGFCGDDVRIIDRSDVKHHGATTIDVSGKQRYTINTVH